jgi:AraC-like DNA-binding protein/mannose-6-phosphate isomerase-like protein (cupin superfamily)
MSELLGSMQKTPLKLQETPRELLELAFDAPTIAVSSEETYRHVQHLGAYTAQRGQHYPFHYHNALELVFYRTGHAQVMIKKNAEVQTFEVRSSNVLIIPAGVIHADRSLSGYSNYFLQIQAEQLGLSFEEVRIYRDNHERTLEHVFASLCNEWRGRSAGREKMLDLLTEQLGVLLSRLEVEHEPSKNELLVRHVERLLEERCTENPSILEIAREVGASPSGVRALFAKLRGYSPKDYLQQVRLERALNAIRSSSLSLEEIADLHGYDSASHLSRHIKQATGLTPGAHRSS